MGSGCGALNCLANALRVLAFIIPSHFAVEKVLKKIMSQSMMIIFIQSGEIFRLSLIGIKGMSNFNMDIMTLPYS